MKYYLIAGEASGDLHGSNLIKGLKKVDREACFRFWGGDLMEKEGTDLVRHYRDLAFMGYIEVLQNLRTIRDHLDFCMRDILDFRPRVVILIDYPGFNLRIARFAKENGFPVFYYISPKVWAWKEGRVKKIRKYVDRMFSILPFEMDYYRKFQYEVVYEGNPVVDVISHRIVEMESREKFFSENRLPDKPVIALLPGSRKQEIKHILPVMLGIIKHYPDHQFVLACTPAIHSDFYSRFTQGYDVVLLYDQTYPILRYAEAALVTSGTATLEAALLKTPEVVCYKANLISIFIAYLLVHVKFISLVNLIMNREVVKELIQNRLTQASLKAELDRLLYDSDYRDNMLVQFDALEIQAGKPGVSERVANRMYSLLTE